MTYWSKDKKPTCEYCGDAVKSGSFAAAVHEGEINEGGWIDYSDVVTHYHGGCFEALLRHDGRGAYPGVQRKKIRGNSTGADSPT